MMCRILLLALATLTCLAPGQLFRDIPGRQISPSTPDWSIALDLADVDGDGDVDLFLGNYGFSYSNTPDRLFLNNGRGGFAEVSARLPARGSWGYARFLDMDGDGDADLAVAGNYVLNVLENDGRGSFTDRTQTHGVQQDFVGLEVLDCDGDGDLDLLGQSPLNLDPMLMINDGRGRFALRGGSIPAVGAALSIDATDLDGDGDQDVILALYRGGTVHLLINDGTGVFTDEPARLGDVLRGVTRARAADVDGDGDRDIVAGLWGAPLRLYRNGGGGVFQREPAGFPLRTHYPNDIAFVDVDLDGDLDLVVANSLDGPDSNRVYLNQGGTFHDPPAPMIPLTLVRPFAIGPADLDGDGDIDLVIAAGYGQQRVDQTRVFTNLLRHVHTAPSPRIGQPLVLDAWHEAEYATVPTPMVAALGPDLLPRPVPLAGWGGFWLAPPAIATLPVAATSVPQGHTSWTLAVPPAQWLVGRSLHFQALALPGHVPWHLTNAVTVTFVR